MRLWDRERGDAERGRYEEKGIVGELDSKINRDMKRGRQVNILK